MMLLGGAVMPYSVTLRTIDPSGSSVGCPRQEYWSGLPLPSAEDIPNPGIEPTSPTFAGRFSSAEPPVHMLIAIIFFLNRFPFSHQATSILCLVCPVFIISDC